MVDFAVRLNLGRPGLLRQGGRVASIRGVHRIGEDGERLIPLAALDVDVRQLTRDAATLSRKAPRGEDLQRRPVGLDGAVQIRGTVAVDPLRIGSTEVSLPAGPGVRIPLPVPNGE